MRLVYRKASFKRLLNDDFDVRCVCVSVRVSHLPYRGCGEPIERGEKHFNRLHIERFYGIIEVTWCC